MTPLENLRRYVWAIGPLPPPVTGMSLLTEKVVARLGDLSPQPLRISNFTSGDARPRLHTRALRLFRTVGCLAQLVAHGPERGGRLYIASNSRGGLLMTGLLIKAGQRLGYTIFLHHHTYNYIDAFDKKMAWIDRSMRANDTHVVHCPQMVDDFRARYSSRCQFAYVYPSIVSLPLAQPRRDMPEPFHLGFLANLTVAKGLDLVLDTFRVLRQKGRDVRLCLAGPCSNVEAERLVSQALEEHKGLISHLGGVYDERKIDFFKSIDCFLFPTKYDCESWGIVLNEALASGLPVITTDRGCVRTLVGTRGGPIIDDARDYVDRAVRQVEAWIDSPQEYVAASKAAIEQADYLHHEAAIQLEQIASQICAPDNSVSVNLGSST